MRPETGERENEEVKAERESSDVICPVCGAACVQRRCKVVCESDQCRGRVIYNCAEF